MAKTARFLYVQQNPATLDGPYIIHTRKPAGILLLKSIGHKTAYFDFVHHFDDPASFPEKEFTRVTDQAGQWYFTQVAQRFISP